MDDGVFLDDRKKGAGGGKSKEVEVCPARERDGLHV